MGMAAMLVMDVAGVMIVVMMAVIMMMVTMVVILNFYMMRSTLRTMTSTTS